jgi:nucleoside-diphosphate-sugar epimerase
MLNQEGKATPSERVVLTGASGILGFHLASQLSDEARTAVLCLQRPSSQHRKLPAGVECHYVDFLARNALREVIQRFRPRSIIHCAASGTQFPKPNWFEMVRFNVDATLTLCESASLLEDCSFVYVSTGLAYRDQGRPLVEDDPLDTLHPYGASKAAADLLVRAAGAEFRVPLTVVRPFSFTGLADSGTRLFPALLRAAAEKRPFDMSPGDQVRDHSAVQDIARGVLAAASLTRNHPQPLRVYNLGSGDTTSLKHLIQRLVSDLDLDLKLNFGARDYSPFEPHFMVADPARALADLGWRAQTNLAYAVWQLAQEAFPSLKLRVPKEGFSHER